MKFYRLESAWSVFDQFFAEELFYTSLRTIDQIENYNIDLLLQHNQSICGFWILEDPSDVLKFWENEPAGERSKKSSKAFEVLSQSAPPYLAGRFCIRIDSEAFDAQTLYADLPLIHAYPSSKFHPAVYDSSEIILPSNPIIAMLIKQVSIPDRFVEIYYRKRWYPKTPSFGRFFRISIEQQRNIDDAVPLLGFENDPADKLVPSQRATPTQPPLVETTLAKRLRTWLKQVLGR